MSFPPKAVYSFRGFQESKCASSPHCSQISDRINDRLTLNQSFGKLIKRHQTSEVDELM